MHPLWTAADRRRAITVGELSRGVHLADDADRLDRQAVVVRALARSVGRRPRQEPGQSPDGWRG